MTDRSVTKQQCPFCGHRDIRSHHRGHPTSGEWVIECHGCSCELTGFASEQDAWERWNKRPALSDDPRLLPSNQQVARLRELHAKIMKGETAFVGSALQDAANEIERQHAALTGERGPTETKSEVEHLRDALGTVRKYLEGTSMATWIDGFFNGKPPKYSAHDYERVIAAGGNGWSTLERLRDMAMENHGFAHETTARVSSEDCPVPEQEYIANMLESSAMWLQGKSTTVWAEEFGHTALMQSYAKFLRDLRQKLGSVQETKSEPQATSMDYGGVGQVGCEGDDGLLRIHRTNETCDVCSSQKASGQLCDCGEFCKASLELSFNPKCRRLAKGLPVNGRVSGE